MVAVKAIECFICQIRRECTVVPLVVTSDEVNAATLGGVGNDGGGLPLDFAGLGEGVDDFGNAVAVDFNNLPPCLLYTSPSPRDLSTSRMPSSA